MDRNSILGLSLIGLIIILYSIYTQPGKEEILAMQQRRDSIAKIEEQKQLASVQESIPVKIDSIDKLSDEAKKEIEFQQLGDFAENAQGSNFCPCI